MIVRILSEGQYRLDSVYLDQLNELDNRLVSIVGDGSDDQFLQLFGDMLSMVRDKGQPVPVQELVSSDIVLPDPGSHINDIKPLFTGEGVVPG